MTTRGASIKHESMPGWLLPALLGLLVWRLAMLQLNATDLFFDEAQYWSWSREPAFGYYSKPPLIAWLIGVATTMCGDGEACIRAPSPILHTATALAVWWVGRELYGTQAGALAALAFATLPGVSLSAGIISTDVPLLMAWAWALAGYIGLSRTTSVWPPLVLGLALGVGLNAKYAMAYFILCAGVHMLLDASARRLLSDWRWWLALAIGAAMIAPNLYWNATNAMATFAHTADNAKLAGRLVNPLRALEFFGAQFGVMGPILFIALIALVWQMPRRGADGTDRLLAAFSLPVIVVITVIAFLSRAHANWAAVAYVAATVWVVGRLTAEPSGQRWLRRSLGLHVVVALGLGVATWQAGRFVLPGGVDPFARTLGWRQIAEATEAELGKARVAGRPFAAVVTDDRSLTAELLYYMRGDPTPIRAWPPQRRPRDHYQLTRPLRAADGEPVLLVSLSPRTVATPLPGHFTVEREVATLTIAAGKGRPRRLQLSSLVGKSR